MARVRDTPQSRHRNPFKALKGLPASGAGRPAPRPLPAPGDEDDGELFRREMAWQEVRPLGAGKEPPAAAAGGTPVAAWEEAGAMAELLATLGPFDTTFKDELPEEPPATARTRRLQQLQQGRVAVDATLDLHGLTRAEALERTRSFLAHAARQGWTLVLVITGRGLRSPAGPVLRRAVEELLHGARDLVLEWREAPRRLGGAGALAVFIRKGPGG